MEDFHGIRLEFEDKMKLIFGVEGFEIQRIINVVGIRNKG